MNVFAGWGLSPIIYGKAVDTTCLIWQSSCEGRGACEFYDNRDFRLKIHAIGLVFKFIAFMSTILALCKVWKWTDWPQNRRDVNKSGQSDGSEDADPLHSEKDVEMGVI